MAAPHLSRIETGKRPPTEAVAAKCDAAFPERGGWFSDWYRESRTWSEVPAGFRDWAEYEESAGTLYVWAPGIIHGLLQTEAYARTLLSMTGAAEEVVSARLASRMERQRRVLRRRDPPTARFVVDEVALYRLVGSPEVMAGQVRHLSAVAAMPRVTLQVVPIVAHVANASELIIADQAVYCEHMAGGYVYTDHPVVTSLTTRFDALRTECYRGSESLTILERTCESWESGASPRIQT
jgi:hypothetical protein